MSTPTPEKTTDPLDALLAEARASLPYGEAGGFGFETRLRARLREEGSSSLLGDWIARISWRFTAAALPLLALAAATIPLLSGTNGSDWATLREGLGGVVAQWPLYLDLSLDLQDVSELPLHR